MIGSAIDWLIFIAVVLLVLAGSKKIPEFARSLGRAIGEFKKGKMEVEEEIKKAMEEKEKNQ